MWLVVFYAVLIVVLLMMGCSAATRIAGSATIAHDAATDIRTEVVGAKQALGNNDPEAVDKHLDTIDGKAVEIQNAASTIHKAVTQVQDVVPWWASILKWGIIASIVGGVVFVLWRVNAFIILEKAIQVVATWIHGKIGKFLGA
jgi:hypothetical protein